MPTTGDALALAATGLRTAAARALGVLAAADRTAEVAHTDRVAEAGVARGMATAGIAARGRQAAGEARRACRAAVAALAPGAAGAPWGSDPTPVTDPLAYSHCVRIGELDGVPLLVPLLDRASLTAYTSESPLGFLHGVTLRALLGTGPGQLALSGFDPLLRGLFAPFAELRQADPDLVEAPGASEADLGDLLGRLSEDVRRITDLRRGRGVTLGGLRTAAGRPVEMFRLVVLLDLPHGLTPALSSTLRALLRAGPACGISFLLHLDPAGPSDLFGDVGDTVTIGVSEGWSRLPGTPVRLDQPPASRILTGAVGAAARLARAAAAPSVRFAELLATADATRSSVDGISVPIGMDGATVVELSLGDERDQRHNVLVTGAVGQGKSNFLKVLVHAVAAYYAPSQVSLYLLDLKDGVSFYPLAATPDSPDWLPQARVIGLESDREFAVAALDYLFGEFERRSVLIRPHGDNLATYLRAVPGTVLPRIVVVIDEFQVLFEETDALTDRAVELVERLARRGRAYGIHLVLASQTISGITALLGKQDGIYAQFPIRIAFKNSAGESRAILDAQNPDAAHLRYRGEAIVNLDFGQRAANRRVVIAAGEDTELRNIRHTAWTRRTGCDEPPVVFAGGRPAQLADAADELLRLRAAAPDGPRVALLGLPIALPLRPGGVALSAEPGRHLAVLGSGGRRAEAGGNLAVGALQAAAVSLALQHPAGDATFTLLNGLGAAEFTGSGTDELLRLMELLGYPVRTIAAPDVPDALRDLAAALAASTSAAGPHYVVGLALDRIRGMDTPGEDFVTGADALRTVLRAGPVCGTHLLGWWTSVGTYRSHLSFDPSVEIDAILAVRVSQRDIVDLMGHTVTWTPRDNRALFHDRHEHAEPVTVVPMAPLDRRTASALLRVDWNA
ncbi:cell division protein FtsK [Longispora fulva]|uniref:FtsK domain-containing protein n=1 Tax=Longispora fulva TaxID=619741 RepID=A0A8J7GCH2_9ACTN|nr:FtsK/SpoIIIE domain-containing protein [Longispora fulva]MBG6133927.1 hypothetical protein [Longispora fulva]GIG62969.1 cell division protein FtsK [Longispora fulva]